MKIPIKNIIILVIIIALVVSSLGIKRYYSKKLDKANATIRVDKIKNDSLRKLNEGLYTKLVADTLSKKELRKVIDSLKLKVKNPKLVTEIVFIPKEVTAPIDGIIVKDSILTINDTYPNKENPFINYYANINLKDNSGVGTFTFTPISLSLGVGQNEDGTYFINTKVPEFIKVNSIKVQALPLTPVEKDNFGVLVGAGLGSDFRDSTNFITLSIGIRIYKFYLEVEGGTNNTIQAGIKIEF